MQRVLVLNNPCLPLTLVVVQVIPYFLVLYLYIMLTASERLFEEARVFESHLDLNLTKPQHNFHNANDISRTLPFTLT